MTALLDLILFLFLFVLIVGGITYFIAGREKWPTLP